MQLLHIANGDGLIAALEKAGISGEKVAWREALSRGPVHPEVGTEAFWDIRERHIQDAYPENEAPYRSWVVPEFERLRAFDRFDAYVLWFGQDYFCQVNQLALLSWLRTSMPQEFPLYLVSVDQYPGIAHLTCLGSLLPGQLATLLPARIPLEQTDLALADRVWRAYCAEDPLIFNALADSTQASNLPFLHRMEQQHRQLFPHTRDGLNLIERTLLQLVREGAAHRRQLLGHFLQQDTAYGLGDAQVAHFVRGMDHLFTEEPFGITSEGLEIWEGKAFFLHPEAATHRNGGALAGDFVWTGEMLKPQ